MDKLQSMLSHFKKNNFNFFLKMKVRLSKVIKTKFRRSGCINKFLGFFLNLFDEFNQPIFGISSCFIYARPYVIPAHKYAIRYKNK